METTKTLDTINDSRKTEPGKYIWGKFTPDAEGVGFQELPALTSPKSTDTVAVDNGGETLTSVTLGNLFSNITLTATELSVSDWNTLTNTTGYSYVHSVVDVTKNAPENVTADWFVESVKFNTTCMLTATRVDLPSSRYIRTYNNGTWSNWTLTYAVYRD